MTIKIGITERGDAGIDFSWADKIENTDYSVIITKNTTTKRFHEEVLRFKHKIILHASITGWGKTSVEPNVPEAKTSVDSVNALINEGFPKSQIVWRIDPIIPTEEGIKKAEEVFELIKNSPIKRIRLSVLDAYPHSKERLKNAGYPLDYNSFVAPKERFEIIDNIIKSWKNQGFTVESCAEPLRLEANHTGCVNPEDAKLFGIDLDTLNQNPQNRYGCLCGNAKTELLAYKKQCPNRCAYCYWK